MGGIKIGTPNPNWQLWSLPPLKSNTRSTRNEVYITIQMIKILLMASSLCKVPLSCSGRCNRTVTMLAATTWITPSDNGVMALRPQYDAHKAVMCV